MNVSESIQYVGVVDKDLDLFEGQYEVLDGVTYNSYIILDDNIAIMDTVDVRAQEPWLKNINNVLGDKEPTYLIVSHMEPDHGACIQILADKYPNMKIVGNVKTFAMMKQFFDNDFLDRQVVMKEGETLNLGSHILQFVMAPMVHWPEVMMSYELTEKVLFSADAFGKFGSSLSCDCWLDEARRYYINIVGKYGVQVQSLLKKAKNLDIQIICPLHGPVLKDSIEQYLHYYNLWSQYQPEESGVVIAYASIHGHTAKVALHLAELLKENGEEVVVFDLSRVEVSYAVAAAFQYDRIVLASASYDGGLFPPMDEFIHHLKSKNFKGHSVAFIENGSWAPSALKVMKSELELVKDIQFLEPMITIRSKMNDETKQQLSILTKSIMEGGCIDEICV